MQTCLSQWLLKTVTELFSSLNFSMTMTIWYLFSWNLQKENKFYLDVEPEWF